MVIYDKRIINTKMDEQVYEQNSENARKHPPKDDYDDYKKIDELYYDPVTGYKSITKFWPEVHKQTKLTFKETEEWLKNQTPYQLTKETKRPSEWSSIVANYPGHNYQMDIIIYNRFKIHNYEYILTVVDVFSRYAAAVPLTNMRMETLISATKTAFKTFVQASAKIEEVSVDGFPTILNCDNQFNKKTFIEFLEQNHTNPIFSDAHEVISTKNAIVERFNKTLALMLQKCRIGINEQERRRGGFPWYSYLPQIISNYNNTIHRTMREKPYNLINRNSDSHQIIHEVETKDIGEGLRPVVRLREKKNIFDKGDKVKYSLDKYMIIAKHGNKYEMKNVNTDEISTRNYKPYELQWL